MYENTINIFASGTFVLSQNESKYLSIDPGSFWAHASKRIAEINFHAPQITWFPNDSLNAFEPLYSIKES